MLKPQTLVYVDHISASAQRGVDFLVARQDFDGFWRDYDLPPGPSEAWSTAAIGLMLATSGLRVSRSSLLFAALALRSLWSRTGWGYNRFTATDADSTAWTIRYLAMFGDVRASGASACLRRYLDDKGRAKTFVEHDAGTWASTHADVTPVVGLALVAIGADPRIIAKSRAASLVSITERGTWLSFWWSTEAYSTARNLEFLAATGGIPSEVARRARAVAPEPRSSFEAAQQLMVAGLLGVAATEAGRCLVDALLDMQQADGGWPKSETLMLPEKSAAVGSEHRDAHADTKRLMSTAMVLYALAVAARALAHGN